MATNVNNSFSNATTKNEATTVSSFQKEFAECPELTSGNEAGSCNAVTVWLWVFNTSDLAQAPHDCNI